MFAYSLHHSTEDTSPCDTSPRDADDDLESTPRESTLKKRGFVVFRVSEDDDKIRLVRFIKQCIGIAAMSTIARGIRHKDILTNGRRCSIKDRLVAGDALWIHCSVIKFITQNAPSHLNPSRDPATHSHQPPSASRIQELTHAIIAITPESVVFNKPFGWVCQGGAGNRGFGRRLDTVARWVNIDALSHSSSNNVMHDNAMHDLDDVPPNVTAASNPPLLVHRLDAHTTGVIVMARGRRNARILSSAFLEQRMTKVYLAIIWGKTPTSEGIMCEPLIKHNPRFDQDSHNASNTPHAQSAATSFLSLATAPLPLSSSASLDSHHVSLLALRPHSGRYHQLRRHLAIHQTPIVGDVSYGANQANTNQANVSDDSFPQLTHTSQSSLIEPRMYLHAWSLTMPPGLWGEDSPRETFHAPLPQHFSNILCALWPDMSEHHLYHAHDTLLKINTHKN